MTTQAQHPTTSGSGDEAQHAAEVHGGHIVAQRLKAHGVTALFTLSGAHIFPIYDGCREAGIRIVDVRHEQTAAFAAEGWAKVTREPGVCAVTAGPGVTNIVSALASAQATGSPMLALGGRAPEHRWGAGSLQEFDHIPVVAPVTKHAATVRTADQLGGALDHAFAELATAPGGPVFLDLPLDALYSTASAPGTAAPPARPWAPAAPATDITAAVDLLAGAQRPVIMAGSGLYWARAESALVTLAEQAGIPVLVNGLGRGCIQAAHPNFFSRARGRALREADVAIIVGTALDFRLGFGEAFGADTKLIWMDGAAPPRAHPRAVDVQLIGDVRGALEHLSTGGGRNAARLDWLDELRSVERERRTGEGSELSDGRAPLHPLRIYGELNSLLDADATVVCDGGDFVSYSGKQIESSSPGTFLDPGTFGCLGSGPGYAIAASLVRPQSQTVLLMGDGAFGFAGMDFDSFVRHDLPVVAVMGNNGIWGLEKHPMELLFGYSVAADLQPGCRYDQVVEALGGHGEFVERPEQLRPALERAFAAGKPALVNVLTDPAVAYPRSTNLA